jgi:hypothetical protein
LSPLTYLVLLCGNVIRGVTRVYAEQYEFFEVVFRCTTIVI